MAELDIFHARRQRMLPTHGGKRVGRPPDTSAGPDRAQNGRSRFWILVWRISMPQRHMHMSLRLMHRSKSAKTLRRAGSGVQDTGTRNKTLGS